MPAPPVEAKSRARKEEADMTRHGQLASSQSISSIDPFSPEFLADPYPFHHELREAGAVVWLERYSKWTVARYDDVHRTLNDWQTFCSNRGVGISDFAKETHWRPPSLVLEKDRPDHDRTRSVLNKVLSPPVIRTQHECLPPEDGRTP